MPPSLDPLIAERLRAFAQRWTRMVWVRGIAAAVVTLLVAFTAVAWLDWRLVLTERTRLLLSLGGYAMTALVFWLVAGRTLVKRPTVREFAGLMEKAWPRLRGHLVAAVELAEKSAEGKTDSFAFRDLMQEGVANRVKDVRMKIVLPRSLVARWSGAALASVVAVAVLLAVPAWGFPRQLARAFIPVADIERVARTKIRVVEPAAETRWLAQGDHQTVAVELAGVAADRAELEVLLADGRTERVLMSPGSGRQFTVTVPVGQGDFAFRVRAGDAITKTLTLPTRTRPAVMSFTKTYEAPAYAQLPPRQVEEEHGNVSALEGSVADLRMRVNQSVRAGELAVIADGKTNRVALTAPEPNVVRARLLVNGSATYQVRLIAAETGLGNKFSPTFEIRAEPDLAPRITLEQPRNDVVAAPDEVVTVRGTAGDDIGLAAVTQQFQVNTGPWVEVPLGLANKTNSPVAHRWDLLLLGLSTGDRVVTKLVAVDLRGTRVESAAAQLVIGAEQSDAKRAKALAARQQVQEALEGASKAATELRKAYTPEAVAKMRAGDDVQRQQTVAGAAVAQAEVERQLERADKQLAYAVREADAGRESAELALLAGGLSTARRELLPRAQADRELLAGELRETPERSNVNEAVKSAQRLADFTAQMAGNFGELVAADQGDALTERLDQLAKEQQRVQQTVDGAGSDPNAWQRVARRETGVTREVARAEQEMADLRQRAPKQISDRLGKSQDTLKAARTGVESTLKNPAGPELAAPAKQMKTATEQAAGDARVAARELGMRADKARAELAKLNEGSAEKIARLRRDLERLAESDKKLAEARRNGEDDGKLKLKADSDRDRAEASWRGAKEQLEDRAKAEEARRDNDPQFAAQLGLARDSLEAMRATAEADWQNAANPERLAQMEKAMRGLEAGRQLSELASAAKSLAREERFEAAAPDSSTSRPRDWNWLEKQMTAAQREARSAGLGEKTANALSEAIRGTAGQQVGREMNERRSGGARVANPMAEQLDQVAGQMQRAHSEAAKVEAEARQALARTTASLSERLLALSRAAAELELELKPAAGGTTPNAVTNLHLKQLTLNVRLADAVSALRRDGNAQDLSLPAGRERARDADAAVEMLREPPVKAESAIRSALAAQPAKARAGWLKEAETQDHALAASLKLLAEHYHNLEAGAAEGSRQALRKQEQALGTRAAQDERYAQMERLQRLAGLPPEELQRELAAELQRNPAMRAELARLSRDAVADTRQRLQEAAEAERTLARQLERAANPALEAGELWAQLLQLVAAMRRTVAEEIPPVQADAEKWLVPVKEEFERGAKSITEAADKAPTQANLPTATIAQRVGEMVPGLQRATNELANAQRKGLEAEKKFAEAQKKLAEVQREVAKTAGLAKLGDGSAQLVATVRRHLDRARALAEAFANVGKISPEQALARAAQQQGEAANQLRAAAENLQRAARDERAMGNQAEAAALQQAAQQAQASADQADRARRAAQDGQQSLAEAGRNAQQLGSSLEQQGAQLGSTAGQSAQQGGGSGSERPGAQASAGQTGADSTSQPGASASGAQAGSGSPQRSGEGGQNGANPGNAQSQPGSGKSNGEAVSPGGAAGTPGVSGSQDNSAQASGTRDGAPRPGAPGESNAKASAPTGRAGDSNQPNTGTGSGQDSRGSQQNSGAQQPQGGGQGGAAQNTRGEGQSGGAPGSSKDDSQAARPGGNSSGGQSKGADSTGSQQRGQVGQGTPVNGVQGAGAPNSFNAPRGTAGQHGRPQDAGQSFQPPPPGATQELRVLPPGGGKPSAEGGMGMLPGRNIRPDARWMARAMDGMNTGKPGAQANASRALEAAQQAQQQMAQQGQRKGAGQGGGPPGSGQPGQAGEAGSGAAGTGRVGGATRAGGAGTYAALPELGEVRDGNWAKLPPKLAQDLREGQQNGVSGDYRVLVDAYFKAVAEKARK